MPSVTDQTLTTMAVADGVAAEITTPADATVWSIQEFVCKRLWLPVPTKDDLAKVVITVIALGRGRAGNANAMQTPMAGRVSRGAVRSTHRLKVLMQKLVDADPAAYDGVDGELDRLGAFLMQVDDYWNVHHRQVHVIVGLTTGATNVEFFQSSVTIFEPKTLDTNMLWAGVIDLTFSEVSKW